MRSEGPVTNLMVNPAPSPSPVAPPHAGTQSVNVFEVRFTNPDEFINEIKSDLLAGHVQDSIVRLATRKAHAILADLEPDRPWDHRPAAQWRTHYVEASYISTRYQLIKLSCFCGVAMEPWHDGRPHTDMVAKLNENTQKQLLRTMRKVHTAIAKVEGLDIRGGGLFVEEGVWVATPGNEIEAPEEIRCATCDVPLYWANGHWRDESRAYQVTVSQPGYGGRTIQVLDHIHDPDEVGRTL